MGNTDKTLPTLVTDKDDIFPEIQQKEGKFLWIKYKKGLTDNDISEELHKDPFFTAGCQHHCLRFDQCLSGGPCKPVHHESGYCGLRRTEGRTGSILGRQRTAGGAVYYLAYFLAERGHGAFRHLPATGGRRDC